MSELVWGAGAAVGAGAAWYAYRANLLRRQASARLNEGLPVETEREAVEVHPYLVRRSWIPYVAGGAALLLLLFVVGLPIVFSVAIAIVVGVLAHLIEDSMHEARLARLETQLANSMDLMVAALHGGAGLAQAIESASGETPEPIKSEWQEVLGRMRYGESPVQVFDDFSKRIPLESFRLVSFTMIVHSEVGGSLAPILATVGRSIRDRIEIARRVRSQSTEARASVMGILLIIYFLGLLMWRTNPPAFERFVAHELGQNLLAGALILQALGMLWIAKIAKLRF
jgi:Flp pilus assembly protein TadB